MTPATDAESPVLSIRDRIIVALDVASAAEARDLVNELRSSVGVFKVGLQLFMAAGPSLVSEFVQNGVKIFLDLKFHDIPNTVAKAGVEAAKSGVWMFNLHTLGGSRMMRQTVEEVTEVCRREQMNRPLIVGVTILTSSDAGTLTEAGIGLPLDDRVASLAQLAADCGLDGVVASPLEVGKIRKTVKTPGFLTVTPGIRSNSGTEDDQKRVSTIRAAVAGGSDYVVIGRPITGAPDRLAALERLLVDI